MKKKSVAKESRRHIRRDIRVAGIVLTPDGQRLVCEVGDISETGALILLETPHLLPHEFMLEIGGASVRRRCQVTRQEGATAGVRFPDRPLPPP